VSIGRNSAIGRDDGHKLGGPASARGKNGARKNEEEALWDA